MQFKNKKFQLLEIIKLIYNYKTKRKLFKNGTITTESLAMLRIKTIQLD